MNKKIILNVIILTIITLSFSYVFAADMTQDASNTVNDSIDKTQNTMNNIGNAVQDAGNSAMNAVNGVMDGTRNAVNELTQDRNTSTTNNNGNMNMAGTTNNNGNYTTTRTATEGTTLLGMNATTWTWLIMGIVGIAIVALVWYYSIQTADHGYDDE